MKTLFFCTAIIFFSQFCMANSNLCTELFVPKNESVNTNNKNFEVTFTQSQSLSQRIFFVVPLFVRQFQMAKQGDPQAFVKTNDNYKDLNQLAAKVYNAQKTLASWIIENNLESILNTKYLSPYSFSINILQSNITSAKIQEIFSKINENFVELTEFKEKPIFGTAY